MKLDTVLFSDDNGGQVSVRDLALVVLGTTPEGGVSSADLVRRVDLAARCSRSSEVVGQDLEFLRTVVKAHRWGVIHPGMSNFVLLVMRPEEAADSPQAEEPPVEVEAELEEPVLAP